MTADIISIQPPELKFTFELRKQITCSVSLVNRTDNHVAFKVKTTSPKKYCVRPNTGVILPGSTCEINVTMQSQREAPPDMQCKDKFLVQSVVLPIEAIGKEISQELFSKAPGRDIFETKLRVVYVPPPRPPSPVAESAEEGISPVASLDLDKGFVIGNDANDIKEKLIQVQSQLVKLEEEKKSALQKTEILQTELAKLYKGVGGKNSLNAQTEERGISLLVVLFVALFGILVGYFLHS